MERQVFVSVKTDFGTDGHVVDDEIDAVPPMQSLRPRRRPWLVVTGIALTATSGVVASMLYLAADERSEVLVLARDVGYGQELTAQDLIAVRVGLDPAVSAVPADELAQVTGRQASVELYRGQVLFPSATSADAVPVAGSQLVAVPLKPGQIPTRGLRPGDAVDLVSTPGAGADPPESSPDTVPGRVVHIGEPQADGVRVVDVETAAADGAVLAARVATGNIAMVLNPAEPKG